MIVRLTFILITLTIFSYQPECPERQVKTESSYGIIMQNNSICYSIPKEASRFQPQKDQIITLEKELEINITEINKEHPNQLNKSDYLENNLSKYNRQYFGFVNNYGERIIFVNLFKETINCKTNEEIIVLDGCSEYWQIFYSMDSKKFDGFSVNGCA